MNYGVCHILYQEPKFPLQEVVMKLFIAERRTDEDGCNKRQQ